MLVSGCFFGAGIYGSRIYHSMFEFTTDHYEVLGPLKFELFRIQTGLELLYRVLFFLSSLWFVFGLGSVFHWQRYVRTS